jgi:hypothetical protein
MALYLDLVPGNQIRIADTTVTIEAKTGARIRVRIDGPDRVTQVKDPPKPFTRPATPQRTSAEDATPRRMSADNPLAM